MTCGAGATGDAATARPTADVCGRPFTLAIDDDGTGAAASRIGASEALSARGIRVNAGSSLTL